MEIRTMRTLLLCRQRLWGELVCHDFRRKQYVGEIVFPVELAKTFFLFGCEVYLGLHKCDFAGWCIRGSVTHAEAALRSRLRLWPLTEALAGGPVLDLPS